MIDLSEPSDQQKGTLFDFAVKKLMREPDARTRLATLEMLLAYGVGKPVQQVEAKTENTTKFIAHVPPVLTNTEWMAEYGNPVATEPEDETEN